MKAIILAAGEGVRMRPLTANIPKPLLKIGNQALLEHLVSRLPQEIDELVLVVGYLGDQIKTYCGDNFFGKKVQYAWQEKKTGTFDALKLAEQFLKEGERFLLLYADDIHGKEGIQECLKHDFALLVSEAEDPKKFGVVKLNPDNTVTEIIEKPANPPSNLVSTGILVMNTDVFKYQVNVQSNGERYLPNAINQMIADGYKFFAVKSNLWIPIGYPEDLAKAEKILQEKNNI